MLRLTSYIKLVFTVVIGLAVSAGTTGCAGPTSAHSVGMGMVREVFPLATEIVEMPAAGDDETSRRPGRPAVSKIEGASRLLGYLVEIQVEGRSGPFDMAVLLDEELTVKRAFVVSYPWPRGRQVAQRSFTRQFEGKGPKDAIEIGKDIDAITGATISCRAMALGVREAIKLTDN